jgi:two-component system, chemotaxis family, chemotaxis protein CheY
VGSTDPGDEMRKVLVVDDDEDMRDLIALMLKREGFEARTVASPFRALEVAVEEDYDVAILDWSMPGMDGGELCARLREHPDLRDKPVLVLTAHADPETRRQAFAAGADDFMTKPFTKGQLAEAVSALLDGRA